MTKEEVVEIMLEAKDSFQRWRDIDNAEYARMCGTWYEMLNDVPYEMAKKAMVDYIKTNQYPPTIADIRKPYHEYLEEQKQLKREYNNIYYTAISFYPCYQDTPELKNEWNRLCGNNIPKANKLQNKIVNFVRERELADEYIPPILEWMKGLEKIE